MKILLAMSGGVDSSVAAHLLTRKGHEVVGVRFALWNDPKAPAFAKILPSKCCTTENIHRANAVAKQLKFPLHRVNLTKEFKKCVVDAYLDAHRRGFTPNPCVECNRIIKFDHLLRLAKKYGCEKVATGHYARIARKRLLGGTERSSLLEAKDRGKDQSYYLYELEQRHLRAALFPLGTLTKRKVLSLAKTFHVPLPDRYIQSQDLCFFPEKTPHEFLKRHLKRAMKPGNIVRRDGKILGKHEGLPLYTIGQRRGLRVGGQRIPLEVVAKDTKGNRLIVAQKGEETMTTVALIDMRFTSLRPKEGVPVRFECRTRSLSQKKAGTLTLRGEKALFRFAVPQPLQTPGQSLVLYRGEEVVGGGVIVSM
ncbi:MAG: tRNA 2-thiouridine(34) synthase MnmA [Candidatus Peribacteraceae bacterium]